jgi:hypothetical protein
VNFTISVVVGIIEQRLGRNSVADQAAGIRAEAETFEYASREISAAHD